MSELTDDRLREALARAIYETDPHYESGEYVDSFLVSPGGNLTWEQALARDAEFAGNRIFLPITKFAFDAADACIIALRAAASTSTEGAGVIEAAAKLAEEGYLCRTCGHVGSIEHSPCRDWDIDAASKEQIAAAIRSLTPPAPKVTTDEAEERG